MKAAVLVALCGCGRIGFAPVGGSSGDGSIGSGDGTIFVDAAEHHDGTCTSCPTFVAGRALSDAEIAQLAQQ